MEWVKLSCTYDIDAKVLRAGEAAEILFVRALAHAGRTESRGFVSHEAIDRLTPRRGTVRAAALVREGLWTKIPGGFQITAWEGWQDEHDVLADRRRRDRDRKARKRREKRDAADSGVHGMSADTSVDVRDAEERRGDKTAAAAAEGLPQPLPGELDILRAKLNAARLVVRWDNLSAEQTAQITALVQLHGDAPLVRAALTSYQANNPPVFAQAWIRNWLALPAPGDRLRLVTERCDHHLEDLPCRGCAADRKAGAM
jgi:hypothetical protein